MIAVVDFGSQMAHLIGRRLKDLGIEVTIVEPQNSLDLLKDSQVMGVVLSGGPASVYGEDAPTLDKAFFTITKPVLGICYGWQLMAQLLDGSVELSHKEYGIHELSWHDHGHALPSPYETFSGTTHVVMSHGDTVIKLPKDFVAYGSTDQVAYAAVADTKHRRFGVQFHPEAEHTEGGSSLLRSFAQLCGEKLEPWSMNVDSMIAQIRSSVGNEKVLCAVSGGVDSTVTAVLLAKAIGKNLLPFYVESGLMRPGTRESVERIFNDIVGVQVTIIEAEAAFTKELSGITDPEEKRKIIGKLYVDLFQKEAERHADVGFLGQGTIYSDVIESKGSKNAAHIKSHHNVGGLPSTLKLKLIEPVRELYKDQVRQLGRLLGLPDDVVSMQAFPGPGYGIRIRGEVTKERLEQLKIADRIVIEEMKEAGLWEKVYQCFALLTGAQSTAVKGDGRAFAEVVAIRSYESSDVMTSMVSEIPYPLLKRMAARIVNEVPNVSRVVYDITSKPPATMEWE